VSTLAVTDPDLIEIFDNFAFDEVMSGPGSWGQLAVIIACQALREYRVVLGATLHSRLSTKPLRSSR